MDAAIKGRDYYDVEYVRLIRLEEDRGSTFSLCHRVRHPPMMGNNIFYYII